MKISCQGESLQISGLRELGAANYHAVRDEICAALPPNLKTIDIDFSQAAFVDSHGLWTLLSLYKTAASHNAEVVLRLVNPTPPVQQVLELTRMHRLFEIVRHPNNHAAGVKEP